MDNSTIILESTLICPNCGHRKTETMPTVPASGFTNVKTAMPC